MILYISSYECVCICVSMYQSVFVHITAWKIEDVSAYLSVICLTISLSSSIYLYRLPSIYLFDIIGIVFKYTYKCIYALVYSMGVYTYNI